MGLHLQREVLAGAKAPDPPLCLSFGPLILKNDALLGLCCWLCLQAANTISLKSHGWQFLLPAPPLIITRRSCCHCPLNGLKELKGEKELKQQALFLCSSAIQGWAAMVSPLLHGWVLALFSGFLQVFAPVYVNTDRYSDPQESNIPASDYKTRGLEVRLRSPRMENRQFCQSSSRAETILAKQGKENSALKI